MTNYENKNAVAKAEEKLKEIEASLIRNMSDMIEFVAFLQKYGSTERYSYRNKLLVFAECKEKDLTHVVRSITDWKQLGVNVVNLKDGITLLTQIKTTNYYIDLKKAENPFELEKELKERGVITSRWQTTDGNEKRIYLNNIKEILKDEEIANLVSSKKITADKRFTYRYHEKTYSIDSTDMKEEDRVNYIKRWETNGGQEEESKEIYDNLLEICNLLDIEVIDDVSQYKSYSGSLSFIKQDKDGNYLPKEKKTIYVDANANQDSKVSILAHELGHFITQKNIKNYYDKYKEDRTTYELQAEFFSNFFCNSRHLDGQNKFSTDYLARYFDNLIETINGKVPKIDVQTAKEKANEMFLKIVCDSYTTLLCFDELYQKISLKENTDSANKEKMIRANFLLNKPSVDVQISSKGKVYATYYKTKETYKAKDIYSLNSEEEKE